jgi:hypothetical protein
MFAIKGRLHRFRHTFGLRARHEHPRPRRDLQNRPMRATEMQRAGEEEQLVKQGFQRGHGYAYEGTGVKAYLVVFGEAA